EERLFSRGQQVVTPINRAAQRLLAGGQTARGAGQKLEPVAERRKHLLRRQQPHARRRKVDGERQAVQLIADLGNGRCVFRVDAEVGFDGPRPFVKQPHCFVLRQLCGWRQVVAVGQGEQRQLV